jgi:FK506-binding protein 2
MGIEGVPKPDEIKTKAKVAAEPLVTAVSGAASAVSEEAEEVSTKLSGKVASVVAEAVDAAKTVLADTDDGQEHNEL